MLGASACGSQDQEQIPRCARDDKRGVNALGEGSGFGSRNRGLNALDMEESL
jgi:hypothetical protein